MHNGLLFALIVGLLNEKEIWLARHILSILNLNRLRGILVRITNCTLASRFLRIFRLGVLWLHIGLTDSAILGGQQVPLALLFLLALQSLFEQFHVSVFESNEVVLVDELRFVEEFRWVESIELVVIRVLSRQFRLLHEFRCVQPHHLKSHHRVNQL